MAIDTRLFVGQQADYAGLYHAADTLDRRREREDVIRMHHEGLKNATANNLEQFFDKKQYLTGTEYDPKIVVMLNNALQKGYQLNAQGLDQSEIMMTLGKDISQLNEYSQKAKMIDQNIKSATNILKDHKGYNLNTIYENAKRIAFHNADGSEKDLDQVDPTQDYVSAYVKQNPDAATNYEGFDQFAKSLPPSTMEGDVTTESAGKKIRHRIKYTAPDYMELNRDQKGNLETDANGIPTGFSVSGHDVTDEKGGRHRLMDQGKFNDIFSRNPSMMDKLRGEIDRTYSAHKADKPEENTPEWNNIALKIGAELLQERGKGAIHNMSAQANDALRNAREQGKPDYKPKEEKTAKPTSNIQWKQ